MDDLSQRDLSGITDRDPSPEEREEMKRRFDDFVTRLREQAELEAAKKAKAKRPARADPTAPAGRR